MTVTIGKGIRAGNYGGWNFAEEENFKLSNLGTNIYQLTRVVDKCGENNVFVDLGVDYGVIKHCSDDEFGTLGVDYDKYEDTFPLLQAAESFSNERTKVIVKWEKIKNKGKPSYKRFYGPQFLLQISGSGLVAPSGMFFNARYSKLHMGNFGEERFKDIFYSDRYWRIMNYLASPNFDAKTMMGTLPIQHYIHEAIDKLIKG